MTAITTELGRNSASVQYGPSSTGADLFTTLQSVDAWLRNDTWAGYATASSTTLTGFNTAWNTVAKAGDYIIVAGQQRVVALVNSDTSITVTQAFSPAITLPSAVRVINSVQPTATGTLSGSGAAGTSARGVTNGAIYCTNGSTTINGVGTYFLSDCTASVSPVTVNGTFAVDASGNITGTGTSFNTGGVDGTNNRLQPGDCIAVLSAGQTYYMIVATIASDTTGTVTTATIPTTAIPAGATLTKAQNSVIGRIISINGRIRTITGLVSNTQLIVSSAMDFTDSNIKLKTFPRGTVSNNASAVQFGTTAASGTGTTLSVGGTVTTGTIIQAGAIISGNAGSSPAGTYIVNQLYSTGTSVANTTVTGQSGGNQLIATSTSSLAVGLLVQGNATSLAGVPANTFIIAINGTTLILNNNLTSLVSAATAYFYPPGGLGVYTVSTPINFTNAVLTVSQIAGVGTNFFWDIGASNANYTGVTTSTSRQSSVGDQILFGDEVRTIRFDAIYNATTASVNAYITDYTNYTSATPVGVLRQNVTNIPYKRDDSFIFGSGTSFTTDIRTGDDLVIDGTEVTVSQVISDTQLKITNDFPSTPSSSTIYKKLKLHGYVLEGTREGGPLGTPTKWSNSGTITLAAGTVFSLGTSTITVAVAPVLSTTYNFIKVTGAGGPPKPITGQATITGQTMTGVGTAFTSELYIGAEIVIAGQYLTVAAIASDTVLTVQQTSTTVATVTPVYRTVPLYTYISNISGTTITLGTPTKNTLFSTGANPPQVWYPQTAGDYVEYVYSAPNYYAEVTSSGTTATNTVLNGSYDRKYVGFRYWPLFQGTVAAPVLTNALATANAAYAMPVYERWAGSYGGAGGAGINQADLSGGLMSSGTQALAVYTLNNPIAGSVTTATSITTLTGTGFPTSTLALASGTAGLAGSTYTLNASQSQPAAGNAIMVHSLNGVYDVTSLTQTSGGFLYLFATKRYFIIQGKSNANIQTQWVGCIEFERAQPEDISGTSGAGTTSGVSFTAYGGAQLSQGAVPPNQSTAGYSQAIQFTPGVAPWPTFAYVNGNRFPTGSMQTPTLPVVEGYPIHGGLFSVPRVRNSSGDLVGINAHVYSAATITTGRWGHQVEMGSYGSYAPAFQNLTVTITAAAPVVNSHAVPQIHLGQILPVFTNVYNAKRFMFSPVVVLGPAYDPDIRGRLFGMKVIPSGLGSLLDTVSITVNATTFFYDSTQAAVDHWVLTTPPQGVSYTAALPGQTNVLTNRFTTLQNAAQVQQSWRSLEDTSVQATSGTAVFYNNFRMAVPA